MQNNIEQRSVDFQLAVVFDETELSESVHKEADAGASCADHFRQRLLANFGNYLLWFPVLAESCQQEKYSSQSLFT